MRQKNCASALVIIALGCICPTALVAPTAGFAAAAKAAAPAIDPEAVAAAERMGAYLRTLQTFQINAAGRLEEALSTGKTVGTDFTSTYKVRRPDAFVIAMDTAKKSRRFIYDGKSFTVTSPKVGYFATVSAPATINDTVSLIYDKYGVVLPLADIFYWGTDVEPLTAVRSAQHIATEQVSGVQTDHYRFTGDTVAWDIWIQQGDAPLPRKMVITTLDAPKKPTYSASLYWMTDIAFAPDTFSFNPGTDAKPIEMANVEVEP